MDWLSIKIGLWDLMSSAGAPAWVQAIGSIAALLVAIYVSKSSIRHASVLRQKTMFSVADAAHKYACSLRKAIGSINDEPGSNVQLYGVYHKDVMAGMVAALQALPVHEFATSQQVISILGLTNQLVFLGVATEKLMLDPSLIPELSKSWEEVGGDREGRRELRSTITQVLKRNALTHLDKFDEHFVALKHSMPS